jgi:hypothetical protein
MSLFVVRLNHAVNVIGPLLQLMLDQLASGFERRLYTDWDAPVYVDSAAPSPDGRRARNGCGATGAIPPS